MQEPCGLGIKVWGRKEACYSPICGLNDLNRPELSISLPPCLKLYEAGPGLVRFGKIVSQENRPYWGEQKLWVYFKMIAFHLRLFYLRAFFSDHHCENMVKILEVNSWKWRPHRTGPLWVFNSQPHWAPPPIGESQFSILTDSFFSWEFCSWTSPPHMLRFYVSPCLSFQLSLWPQFSDESKISCWFSVCSTFVLSGWEW